MRVTKKNDRASTMEGLVRSIGVDFFWDALLIEHKVDFHASNKVLQATNLFLKWNTALRWVSNLKRHYGEPGYELEPNQIEEILEFLNQKDFEVILPKVAFGALAVFALIEFEFSSYDSTFEEKCESIYEMIEKACTDPEESSLKVYEKRLQNLTWGPQNYLRNESFITDAHTALRDSKIIAFYGLGGVGKTAIAQKLMFDIINNREPFTHVVTHSSKVGSDQKEINTITPRFKGSHSETNEKTSVMESSLIDIEGVKRIGGLRMLLKKIYKETTRHSGENYTDKQLQNKVFTELRKEDNQVLIVIDNYEDIEDNQDDADVLQIKDEIKVFLEDFSKLSNTRSRVIITTRSSPLDVAYGLEVKHLTRDESTQLFLEKIRFRSLRLDNKNELRSVLTDIHQLFSQSQELKEELTRSFDLWEAGVKYIAHPLFVLLAAEDVEKNEPEHITKVIREWGEGRKHADIIEYCVSKTLGSFQPYEIELLKFLTHKSHLNTEISIKLLADVIAENLSKDEQRSSNGQTINDTLRNIKDHELIDVMNRLCDRTFVRIVNKRSSSGGTCWFWNKIVYEYLKNKRFKITPIQPVEKAVSQTELMLREVDDFFKPIAEWNKSRPGPIGLTELVNPLEESINRMIKDLSNRFDGQKISYTLSSIEQNLDKQTCQLVKMLMKVVQHLPVDATLNGLKVVKPIGEVIENLLKLLGRQARCWRFLALFVDSEFPPSVCIRYAVELLNRINRYSKEFYDADILDKSQYENLLLHFGKEHIEIFDSDIEVNGTDVEYSTLQRLDWLELLGKHFEIEKTSLTIGLELLPAQLDFFIVWKDVFQRTTLEDQNAQLALVEGYAFWVYLRLFATDRVFARESDVNILNELKHNASFVRRVPNLDQYIRSVQGGLDRQLREPNEYLDAIINFHSQPTNGTLLQTSIRYVEEDSRWVKNLERKGWEIVVLETNNTHELTEYPRAILVQERFLRTNKKIICSFYRDDDGSLILEPEESMILMVTLEKVWREKIDKLVKDRLEEGRNEVSLTEMIRLFKDNDGPDAEKPVVDILARIMPELYKVAKYFVIDPNKPHSPPPPEYQELKGWGDVFSHRWTKDRIILPLDPSIYANYIKKFISMLDSEKTMTLRKYRIKIRDTFNDHDGHGAYFIFNVLHPRHVTDWQDIEISELGHTSFQFVKKLEKSVLGKCQQFAHNINKEVVTSYFSEIMASFESPDHDK